MIRELKSAWLKIFYSPLLKSFQVLLIFFLFLINGNFSSPLSDSYSPTHHQLHARRASSLSHPEFNNNHVKAVKRENQLNSHFLLHRLPFHASFCPSRVNSSSRWLLCWIASLSFLNVCTLTCSSVFLRLNHSHHLFRFINL